MRDLRQAALICVLLVYSIANPLAADDAVERAKDDLFAGLLKKVEASGTDDQGIREARAALGNMRWLGQRMRTAETVLLHELAGKRGNALSRSIAEALVVIGPQERKVVESLVAKGEIPRTRASDTYSVFADVERAQRLDFATRREDGILGAESQPGIAGKLPRSHSR